MSKQIYIKKRSLSEWIVIYIFVFPFLLSFLSDFLDLPSIIKYTIDLAWILSFIFLFFRKRIDIKKVISPFVWFIIALFLYTLFVYLANFQSPFYYLWGVRNNFRFYIAFLAFITFLDKDDIKTCFAFFDIVFWINVFVVFFQFFILDLKGDYLGGVFGVQLGANGWTFVFFCITTIKSVLFFFYKKEKIWMTLSKSFFMLIISAMAELKFFFIIYVVIVLAATILTEFSWRKFLLLIFVAALISIASTVLTTLFQGNDLSFENILNLITASSYSSQEDLGRFTAIPTISKTFLIDWSSKLFGLGLGNCDTSAFAICNTPFFQTYGSLNYNWFSSAFLFLETGAIGLIAYLVFFVICFVFAYKRMGNNASNTLLCQMSIIMSIVCVMITFYNSSLRTETGYMVYFVLALPYISANKNEAQFDDIAPAVADNI